MAFSDSIRREALVKSIRRCCVCRRYTGVGIEVHHIKPQASGGQDTLDNAIVLCFDCHTAAGHYNTKHPRGTKYSPKELRQHRDEWWAKVESSGIADPAPVDLPDYYVRHLICMDYEATRELLRFDKQNLPFDFNYLEENVVADFMRHVLEDDLPYTWAMSKTSEGNYWGTDTGYQSVKAFHDANPNFQGADRRKVELDDFGSDGIRSKLLLQCFKEGLSGEELGHAIVYNEECGGSGYTYYYSVRRPVFIFAHIKNTSYTPIMLEALISQRREIIELSPMPYTMTITNPTERDMAPLRLEPGQSVLVPEMVLLTDPHYDDYTTVWSEYNALSLEQGQDFGFRNTPSEHTQDYYLIGPSEQIHGFKANCQKEDRSFPVHSFDPNRCYMMARYWHVGSCPHVFFETTDRVWVYSGDILIDGYNRETTSEVIIPAGASRMRIIEIEIELTHIHSLKVNGREQLDASITLQRGDNCDFDVEGADQVLIIGRYSAVLPGPASPAHIRQKNSMLRATQTEMNMV